VRRVPAPWLVAVVGVSFLVRTGVGWLRATPILFPDEYIYTAIGRSLADSGRPQIRGGAAHFPALLEPILTAPAWLVGDVETSYRIVQAIGALAMSLAAVPVYLLARGLGLSRRIGLALAALAVLVPDLVYASFISSEAFAYPLVLAAVAAAVSALARPSRRSQLAFVAFAGLAAFTRVQFAVLPLVFVLALLAVGMRERRVRTAVREQALPLVLFAAPLVVALAGGAARLLGYYHGALGLRPEPVRMLRWMGWDAMALAYASGWIVVPGALLGLTLALARPRDRRELAFGAVSACLALALLVQAGVFQADPGTLRGLLAAVNGIKERYLFYLVPLVGICFALYARRGWPLRLPHLVLAGALLLVSVRVPLSGFAVGSTLDASPILYGVYWLGGKLDDVSAASLAVAVAAALLLGVAVATCRRPRLATPLALVLALLATATASAGAVAFNIVTTEAAKRSYLPGDPSYVDHSGLRNVALVQSSGGTRSAALQQLFWNRSVDRVLLLPGAQRFDVFDSERVTVADDGSLLAAGRTVRGPLLVDGFGSTVRLQGARPVVSGPVSTLWAPAGTPRLALYADGRYYDGWLVRKGTITIWPSAGGKALHGRLMMALTLPRDREPLEIRFKVQAGPAVDVRLLPGARAGVDLPVCASGPWRARFRASSFAITGGRIVSARATALEFSPDPSACPAFKGGAQRSRPGEG
jgi:cell shape-determining protein MreD